MLELDKLIEKHFKSSNEKLSFNTLLEMIEEQGIWNEDTKKTLEELEEKEDKYKKEVFEFFFDVSNREGSRRELERTREEILKLNYDRHSYDFLTCEGEIIAPKSLKGKWQNNKCLIVSN